MKPQRHILDDLKNLVVSLSSYMTAKEIDKMTGIKPRTTYRARANLRNYGRVSNPSATPGRPRLASPSDIDGRCVSRTRSTLLTILLPLPNI